MWVGEGEICSRGCLVTEGGEPDRLISIEAQKVCGHFVDADPGMMRAVVRSEEG